MSMEIYKYQELEPGSIRLLEFRSLRDGELAFKVHHKKLGSLTTSYTALSYRWGDPANPPPRVRINDSYLTTTPNLRDALIHLTARSAGKSSLSSHLIWVDAICINQADTREKSQQVSMMGQIYNQADKVFVWLGIPSNERNMRLAVEKLEYMQKLFRSAALGERKYRPWWWPRQRSSMQKNHQAMSRQIYRHVNKIFGAAGTDAYAAWQGIVEIWQNLWWERAWVAQEGTVKEPYLAFYYSGVRVHSPKYKIIFVCGEHTTSWEPLANSIISANTLLKMPLLDSSTALLKGAAAKVMPMLRVRRRRLLDQEESFLETLQTTRLSQASNPRDKIYANLYLLKQSTGPWIRPDYNKSVLDTYLDVVRMQLEQVMPTLDFLGYAMKLDQPRRELSNEISHDSWPSWIPNWDDPLNIHPFPKTLYAERDTGRHVGLYLKPDAMEVPARIGRVYNASRNEDVIAYISGYQLHVHGAIIDTICDTHSYQNKTIAERREQMNRWSAQFKDKYPNHEAFNVGLLRTQVADVKRDFITGNVTSRGYAVNNNLLNKRHAELTPEEEEAQTNMKMCLNMATSFRGLCLTKRGYVGLVPWPAKTGDHICMFLGGQVLYVLRPRRDEAQQYEYIGEAFVYALMDGEALDWVRQGNSVIEEFTLV